MTAIPQRALKVVGTYVVLGALWIVGSDELLSTMGNWEAGTLTRYHSLNGLLFLAVTGALLYWVILRGMFTLEARFERLSTHDSLTDLPRMPAFRDHVDQEVVHARRAGRSLVVVTLNVDRFQHLVNQFGYDGGDEMLALIARRLESLVRAGDIVSRIAGDEFVVSFSDVRQRVDIDHLVLRLVDGLKTPIRFRGSQVSFSISFGVAVFPDDGEDSESLVRHSATALRRTKSAAGGSVGYYTAKMGEAAREWAQVEHALAGALERREFTLHYQPQVDGRTGALIGAEALIRWNSPSLGAVAPGRFIPIAEASLAIVSIGEWVLHEACRQAAAWRRDGFSPFVMSVNVSARQLKEPTFVETVGKALKRAGLGPECLEIELTESMLMDEAEEILRKIRALKAMGVRIAIDDFGTGYSNLAYLRRFNADRLKIDQSFVRGLPGDRDATAIVRTVVALGTSLGLRTIAEGVEEPAQRDLLVTLGCDELQGYLLGRPMPAAALASLFARAASAEARQELAAHG